MDKIRIAVCGIGNVGRAVLKLIPLFPDMECVGAFTRRDPLKLVKDFPFNVYSFLDIERFCEDIDVLLLTLGSREDLPAVTPCLSRYFDIVDCFDDHERMEEHFIKTDREARAYKHTALIAGGWDPGLFSLFRLLGKAVLPNSNVFTFWGKGVSAGHSDAVRRIQGVLDAVEYTIPDENYVDLAKKGQLTSFKKEKAHRRECFVLADENTDKVRIADEIKNIPGYFKGYETEVHFIGREEMKKHHSSFSHEGEVSARNESSLMDFKAEMASNPEFTASVLLCLARSVYVMKNQGEFGAKTIFDIKPKWLIIKGSDLLKFI